MQSRALSFALTAAMSASLAGCSILDANHEPSRIAPTELEAHSGLALTEAMEVLLASTSRWEPGIRGEALTEREGLETGPATNRRACPDSGTETTRLRFDSRYVNRFGQRVMGPGDEAQFEYRSCAIVPGMTRNGRSDIYVKDGHYDIGSQAIYPGSADIAFSYRSLEEAVAFSSQPRCVSGTIRYTADDSGRVRLRSYGLMRLCDLTARGQGVRTVRVHDMDLTRDGDRYSGHLTLEDLETRTVAKVALEGVRSAGTRRIDLRSGVAYFTGSGERTLRARFDDSDTPAFNWVIREDHF